MSDNDNERNRKSPAHKIEVEAQDTSHEREDERVTEQDKFGNAALLSQMDLEQASSDAPPRGAADVALDHFFDNGGIVDIDDDTPVEAADLPFSNAAARRRREEDEPSLEALLAPDLPPEDEEWLAKIRAAAPQTRASHPLAPPSEILSGLTDRWLRTAAPFIATTPLRAAQLATIHPPPARLQGREDNVLLGISVSLALAGALLRDTPRNRHIGIGIGLDLSLWASLSASPWRPGETVMQAVSRHVTLPQPAAPTAKKHSWFQRIIKSSMALSTSAVPQLVVMPPARPPRDPTDPIDIDAILAAELPSSIAEDHLHVLAREAAAALAENAAQIHERLALAAWSCCVATRSSKTAAGVAAVVTSADEHLLQARTILQEIERATHRLEVSIAQLDNGLHRVHRLLRKARVGSTQGLSAAIADGVPDLEVSTTLDPTNPVVAAFSDGHVLASIPQLRAADESDAADWLEAVLLGRGEVPAVPHHPLIQAVLYWKSGAWDKAQRLVKVALKEGEQTHNGALLTAATLVHLESGGEETLRDQVGQMLASSGSWVALSLLSRWTPAPNH